MQDPTDEERRRLEEVARRHGVSRDAALAVLRALAAGGGAMAQFSHPELGGMGQWSRVGMIMVGDMFDPELRRRVDALCTDLAALLRTGALPVPGGPAQARPPAAAMAGSGQAAEAWWPTGLGAPSATGAQNGTRYAYFPAARRLAVQRPDGQASLHDTGGHRITGVSQQQGSGGGGRPLAFSTAEEPVRLEDLPTVDPEDAAHPLRRPPEAAEGPTPAPAPGGDPPAGRAATQRR